MESSLEMARHTLKIALWPMKYFLLVTHSNYAALPTGKYRGNTANRQ